VQQISLVAIMVLRAVKVIDVIDYEDYMELFTLKWATLMLVVSAINYNNFRFSLIV
jgi:hypothetical protein